MMTVMMRPTSPKVDKKHRHHRFCILFSMLARVGWFPHVKSRHFARSSAHSLLIPIMAISFSTHPFHNFLFPPLLQPPIISTLQALTQSSEFLRLPHRTTSLTPTTPNRPSIHSFCSVPSSQIIYLHQPSFTTIHQNTLHSAHKLYKPHPSL